jgi:hypothetical protein
MYYTAQAKDKEWVGKKGEGKIAGKIVSCDTQY